MRYIIDAQGKKLGRIASEAARLLRGKGSPAFTPNVLPEVEVEVINASRTALGEKKLAEKSYRRYSGYPGGLKETSLRAFIEKRGLPELYRSVVLHMLPRNKMRSRLIKRLTVKA